MVPERGWKDSHGHGFDGVHFETHHFDPRGSGCNNYYLSVFNTFK